MMAELLGFKYSIGARRRPAMGRGRSFRGGPVGQVGAGAAVVTVRHGREGQLG